MLCGPPVGVYFGSCGVIDGLNPVAWWGNGGRTGVAGLSEWSEVPSKSGQFSRLLDMACY